MRRSLPVILCLALLAGCQAQDVSTFWDTHDIDYSDIRAAEDQFAEFAGLAASAPEQDALQALDALFDKMKQDTVGYYIYSDWMNGAFYLPPCRNVALYDRAVERIVTDGILNESECDPFLERREWIRYNLEGTQAIVPGLAGFDARTLVLVLDLGCSSCREALETLAADPQWSGVKKVAVGMGSGLMPEVPGWEFISSENAAAVFDIHLTPVYFVVTADGTVERDYTLAL